MKDFPLVGGLFSTPPIVGTDWFQFGRDSASVSANGSAGAILWVLQTDNFVWGGPVVLHAYDATNISRILYTSQQAGSRDVAGPAVKFSVPTVANGKVFVGTQNALIVYGLLP
jgi:outer membrane protein assembly factor BamB